MSITSGLGHPASPFHQGETSEKRRRLQTELAPVRHFMPSASDTIEYTTVGKDGPRSENTTVESLLGSRQIFDKVQHVLSTAKHAVLVDLYNLQSHELYPERSSPVGTPGSEVQASLLQRLIGLRQENKNVRVVLDNSKQTPRKNEEGKLEGPFEAFNNDRAHAHLLANQVDSRLYPQKVASKSHVKILIGDNDQAVISGMNWGNHSAANHDAGVYIKGPDARNIFHKVFRPDWITAGGKRNDLPFIMPFRQGKIEVLQTSGLQAEQGAKDEIRSAILQQINEAKESVHAELFVLTHKAIVDALIAKHAALKQNGKEGVKLLVDPGLFFQFPNCRSGIQKLAEAGVPIRFFNANRNTEEKLHAKWAVFDAKNVIMGSANWSALGLESQLETRKGKGKADKSTTTAGTLLDPELMYSAEPYSGKTNHEVALLIRDVHQVGGNFAAQARHDFFHASFPILKRNAQNQWRAIHPQSLPASSASATNADTKASSPENTNGAPPAKRVKRDTPEENAA